MDPTNPTAVMDDPKIGIIYVITNTVNGKCYVGSTVRVRERWRHHKWELHRGVHKNLKLQRAWSKYGEPAFVFSILEECPVWEMKERETYWIHVKDTIRNGYNILEYA